jgi:addiction module RelE/StbE family toxin
MRIRLTPQAKSDLELIYQYFFKRSQSGASKVLAAIHDALNLLAEHPHAAQATEHQDIRAAVVRRYPYRIFYTITTDAIEILHIRHTSRRPWLPPP